MWCQCLSVYMKEPLWLTLTSSKLLRAGGRQWEEATSTFSQSWCEIIRVTSVSIGNISLCYSVKVLDPNTAEVYSCSESDRGSGRCPSLLWYQGTPSENRSLGQEAFVTVPRVRGHVLDCQLRESEVTLCQVIASQPRFGWGRSGYDSRKLQTALRLGGFAFQQTTGHPLFSEKARCYWTPVHRALC